MRYTPLALVVIALMAGCNKKTEPPSVADTPKIVHTCPAGGGKIVLAKDAPDASVVHANNAGCVLEYLASFKTNPLDGTTPIQENIRLCASLAKPALVVKADLEKGKSLEDEIAGLKDNPNPMVTLAVTKVIRYVYSHPQESGDAARKLLEEQCTQEPRSFYLIHGDEVRNYRVIDGPASPEQEGEAMAQVEVQKAEAEANAGRANRESQVQACIAEVNRDRSAASAITTTELEAACRAGVK